MKRTSTVLVAVAMMVGSLATGCVRPASQAVEPESQPVAAAPAQDAQPAGEEKTTVEASVAVRLPAPPALRAENPGRAPTAKHVWQRGYWRYESPRAQYEWVPGYWENTAVVAPYAPPTARYEDPGYAPSVEFAFVPGYYRWSGAEYVWVHGHWSRRADCGYYYRPAWVNEHGRWAARPERWSYERGDVWYREHGAASRRTAADPRPSHRGEGRVGAAPRPSNGGHHQAAAPTTGGSNGGHHQAAAPTTGGSNGGHHQAAAPTTGGSTGGHQAAAPTTSPHKPLVDPHLQPAQPAHAAPVHERVTPKVPVVVNHPSPSPVTPVRAAAAPARPMTAPAVNPARRRG